MKNSKGETLPQPYYDLALMRREQNKFFSNEKYLASSFSWVDTLEGSKFWAKVSNGNIPEIPAASLAELEAWRKSREENKQSEFWGKAAMVADELRDEPVSESKFKAGDKVRIISDTLNHKFKIGEIVILDQINTSGMSWRCHDLCKKDWWNVAISDMELVENAPDTTDYKAMYESEKEKAEYYEKQYNVLKDAVITPTAELQSTDRNWVAGGDVMEFQDIEDRAMEIYAEMVAVEFADWIAQNCRMYENEFSLYNLNEDVLEIRPISELYELFNLFKTTKP